MDRGKTRNDSFKPVWRQRLSIATVFQDPARCENLDVVANLFRRQELSPWSLDEVQMEAQARTLLRELSARCPSDPKGQ